MSTPSEIRPDSRITIATCRACEASVIHAVTAGGNRVLLDAEPSENGDVRVVYRRGDVVPTVRFIMLHERGNYPAEEPFYVEHICSGKR